MPIPHRLRKVFRVAVDVEGSELPHIGCYCKSGEHEPGYQGLVLAETGKMVNGDMLLMVYQGKDVSGFVYSSADRLPMISDQYDCFELEPMGVKAIWSFEVEARLSTLFVDPEFAKKA